MFEFSHIGSVLDGLKQGEMVVVVDDPNRENEGDLVMIAEKVTPEAINFMAKYGRGLICMPLEKAIIEKLELPPMVGLNTDPYGTAFTVSIDVDNGSTGISAYDRAATILKATSEGVSAEDFKRPGHIFPLAAKEGGVLVRRGHTEASVDLAKLAGAAGAAVICEILNEDGTMARLPELIIFAKTHGLKMMTIEALAAYRQEKEAVKTFPWLEQATETKMPTAYGDFKSYGFVDHRDGSHHMALVMGDVRQRGKSVKAESALEEEEPVLVRVHSECLTGDVFGSKRCDCGQQLDKALKAIAEKGRGVLIYLRQEGRGIGLINKLKCYELQEQGHDTVSANLALGFEADLRDYSVGGAMLQILGVSKIQLITNNPEKMASLKLSGIQVAERVEKKVEVFEENKVYIQTKIEKMNHIPQTI